MPELPEVETVVRGLRERLLGARIERVEVRAADLVRDAPVRRRGRPQPDWEVLHGACIRSLDRVGKYIVFAVEAGARWQLMIHLGMTGKLLVASGHEPHARHTHAVIAFAGGRELRYVDPRRFGRWALAPAPARGWAPELRVAPGAEPLEVGADEFTALFANLRAPIKNALLNQKRLRGLGNIYADESLFRAGIDPRAHAVSRPRLRRLRQSIREVLVEAIAAGGSSISDYVDSAGQPGWFQIRHRVYGRTGQPCRKCRAPIRRLVLAGRSAHFCPRCQRR